MWFVSNIVIYGLFFLFYYYDYTHVEKLNLVLFIFSMGFKTGIFYSAISDTALCLVGDLLNLAVNESI